MRNLYMKLYQESFDVNMLPKEVDSRLVEFYEGLLEDKMVLNDTQGYSFKSEEGKELYRIFLRKRGKNLVTVVFFSPSMTNPETVEIVEARDLFKEYLERKVE